MPVGEDQRQHLELTRDLAQRFNTPFGQTFTVPAPYIVKDTAKITDLQDPTAKMSKSASSPNGIIELLEDPARSAKKIKSAVTDTGREIVFDAENKPGVSQPADDLLRADRPRRSTSWSRRTTARGYGDLKKDLAEVVVEFVTPIQERTQAYLDDPAQLDKLLAIGAEKARAVAAATLRDGVRPGRASSPRPAEQLTPAWQSGTSRTGSAWRSTSPSRGAPSSPGGAPRPATRRRRTSRRT